MWWNALNLWSHQGGSQNNTIFSTRSSPASFPAVLSLVVNAKNINSYLIEYISILKARSYFPHFSFFLKTALNEFQTNRGHSESWNLHAPKGAKCWITVVIEPENELRLHTHHHNTIILKYIYLYAVKTALHFIWTVKLLDLTQLNEERFFSIFNLLQDCIYILLHSSRAPFKSFTEVVTHSSRPTFK